MWGSMEAEKDLLKDILIALKDLIILTCVISAYGEIIIRALLERPVTKHPNALSKIRIKKVQELLILAEKGIESEIVNATKSGSVKRALPRERGLGTLIKWK